jgi:hypothetical protein
MGECRFASPRFRRCAMEPQSSVPQEIRMARFAERTQVTVEETILEIRKTVARYGGDQFVFGVAEDKIVVGFTNAGRQVRFAVKQDAEKPQVNRQQARALLLVLKAKLEAVASGVMEFEDEFLANIVMPSGKLLGQEVREKIAVAYDTGEMPALLPDYTK